MYWEMYLGVALCEERELILGKVRNLFRKDLWQLQLRLHDEQINKILIGQMIC